MGEHRDEGFGDKVKDALGMEHDTATTDDREDREEREGGWAGVGQMMDERDSLTGTPGATVGATDLDVDVDVANRPAGPDYGADDRPDA